jgi:LysM repeat protein
LLGALLALLLAAFAALAAGLSWLQNARPNDALPAPAVSTTPSLPLASPSVTPTPTATPTLTPRPSATHFPTRTVTPTPLPVSTYTVQAGETLSAIAFRLGLSLANLAGYNQIADPALIHAGQVLQVPPGGYTSPPLPTPSGPKQVIVSISQQRVFTYQGDRQIYNFLVSTGKDNSTWTGSFTILDKLPYPYSTSWGFYMPYWLGIYYNPDNGNVENGFHALPITPAGVELWGDDLGVPISFGCIVLAPYDAKVLYDWVEVGTPVLIYP